VSTFDDENQTWIPYYLDMLSARTQPGVVSYSRHVIFLGGKAKEIQDYIEILDWQQNM